MSKLFHCALFIVIWSLFAVSVSASTIARPMHNSGLVGYWNFEEGTGNSQTFDRSGRGNTGTLTNMDPLTDWVKGATSTGQALDFDGTGGLNMGDPAILNFGSNQQFTISVWIKGNFTDADQTIVAKRNTAGFQLTFTTAAGVFFRIDEGGANVDTPYLVADSTILNNQWHHLVVGRNATEHFVYFDGALDNTTSDNTLADISDNLGLFRVGTLGGSGGFVGQIDEYRVYNRALTSSAVERPYKMKNRRVAGGIDNTGLVGYWDFEEGMGTRATDSSFNSNTGTVNGGPAWVQGRVGGALNFDGSDDYIDAGDPSSGIFDFGASTNFTISAWINSTAADGAIIGKINAGVTGGYNFRVIGNQLSISLSAAGTCNVRSSIDPTTGTWKHVTVVVNRNASCTTSDLVLYIDGVRDTGAAVDTDTGNANANVSTAELFLIGAIKESGTIQNFATGQIDEVRVYNRALSATEIYNLYKGSKAAVVNKTNKTRISNGLVGHWTFDGRDIYGTTALDSTSNKNNGTLTGAPAPTLGQIGQALDFDGVDDYVQMGDLNSLDSVTTFTVSAWFKRRAVNSLMYIVEKATDNTHVVALEVLNDGLAYLLVRNGVTGHGTFATNDTNWHHIVMVYDGSQSGDTLQLTGYLDGVKKTLAIGNDIPTSTADHSGNFSIGDQRSHVLFTDGKIDDVRIYNRALSNDEIYQLYNSSR